MIKGFSKFSGFEVVDAKARRGYVKVSEELEVLDYENLQKLIDENRRIDIDTNIDIGDNVLKIGSNKEIFSSNRSRITGNGELIRVYGTVTETETILTFTSKTGGTFEGNLEVGKKYFIKILKNVFELGNPYFMGNGTENNPNCYVGFYATVTEISGANFKIDNGIYVNNGALLTTAKVYEYDPVYNTDIHDLILYSRDTNANKYPLRTSVTSGCLFRRLNISKDYGPCILAELCDNLLIDSCSLKSNNQTYVEHYDLNCIRMAGGLNSKICNCFVEGTQPIDVTFNANSQTATAFVEVFNNSCQASYTGMTLHPGTFGCIVHSNKFYSDGDGISIRGAMHKIYNNEMYYMANIPSINDYGIGSVEGCLNHDIYNNFISNFPVAYYIQEATDRPYNLSGIPFVKFENNIIEKCSTFLKIQGDSLANALSLNGSVSNNLIRRTGTINPAVGFINIKGTHTGTIQFLHVVHNKLQYYTMTEPLVKVESGILRRVLIDIIAEYCTIDPTYSGNGTVTNVHASIKGCNNTKQETGTPLTAMETIL